jgi:very-short-patch-repair endonuclease
MVRTITELARKLRKKQTKSEVIFWDLVRSRKFFGLKFFRQFPFEIRDNRFTKYFIADFYCPELKLVIEIDGGIHEQQKEYDAYRTEVFNSLDVKVIRFENELINRYPSQALESIKEFLPLSRIERGQG